jgi:uncharacterized membrane-anchored protein
MKQHPSATSLSDRLLLINAICRTFESDQENATLIFRIIQAIAGGTSMIIHNESPVAESLKKTFNPPETSVCCIWNHISIVSDI